MESWFMWGGLIVLYFAPSIEAGIKNKHNTPAIFALNLLLGWTLIGWISALVWSLMIEPYDRSATSR